MIRDFGQLHKYDKLFSNKWNLREEKTHEKNILPMWVADMDFETAPAIEAAIKERADTAIYGYASETKEYFKAVCKWFSERHNWHFSATDIVYTAGVASALVIGLHTFSKKNDGVLILTPVYHKFFQIIHNTQRTLVQSPLLHTDDGYAVNFTDFEDKIKKYRPKIFILCNPHNPVGKVFTKDELEKMAQICFNYNVMIFSDEIHGDLVFEGKKYTPLASLSPEISERIIACTSPSKAFNLAGLRSSSIIISNSDIRKKFKNTIDFLGYPKINLFSLPATIAAYTQGAAWLDEALSYIEANRDFALTYLKQYLPMLQVHKPQGTYFLWLDFRAYAMGSKNLEQFLLHTAKVWVNQGYVFGDDGIGFVRMNIACPCSILQKALQQIRMALATLPKTTTNK